MKDATTDPATLASWRERWPLANWGIPTGAISGVIVLDVDGDVGRASFRELQEKHGRLPGTLTVRTGNGHHLYFQHPGFPIRNSASKAALGQGLDIRGDGGYVVAPGGVHASGKRYEVIPDLPAVAAPAPEHLLELIRAPPPAPAAEEHGTFPPAGADVLEAARQALLEHGPAIEGQGGDDHTYRAAALLTHEFALTPREALPLFLEWNKTCSPPWREEDLRDKLAHGEKYGTGPYGTRRPADRFKTAMQIIDEWEREGTPPGMNEAARLASMARMIAKVQAIRWDKGEKGARGIVLQRLKAATGLPARDLDLPKATDLQALAAAEERREQASAGRGDFSDRQAPLDIARDFLKAGRDPEDLAEIVRWRGDWYRARGTHYEICGEEEIKGELYRWLDRRYDVTTGAPVKPDDSLVRSVLDALKGEAALPAGVQELPAWIGEPAEESPARDWIALRNGLLNVVDGEFRPPTRRFFGVNCLPFKHDPHAPPPAAWLDFLRGVWGDDVESIETLQEFMGLALTSDTSHQKALMLVGPKRAGKGTIARVLQALVGADNYCSPRLEQISRPFGLEPLINKTLAVISDAQLGSRADQGAIGENLKRITGEDAITVDRKFRGAWTGKLTARFMILCNELPALQDQSGALASRFIVLQLERSFYGREDHGLTDRLLGELPGILLWALEGLNRLRARGRFRQPASALEAMRQLDVLGSPIRAFVADRCRVGPGRTIEVGELYREWCAWCQEQGRHPGTSAILGRNLHAAVPGLELSRPQINGGRVRVYRGIGLSVRDVRDDSY